MTFYITLSQLDLLYTMSLFELLVIFIVAFLVIKPEDLPQIIKRIKSFYSFFAKTKTEISSYFDIDQKDDIVIDDDIDQINFFLEKITNLGGEYEGEYSVNKIRDYYQKLVKESIKAKIEQNSKTEL